MADAKRSSDVTTTRVWWSRTRTFLLQNRKISSGWYPVFPGKARQSWILHPTLRISDSRNWIPDSSSEELGGRFLFSKNSGLKFRKFHVPNGTVHSGCTDPTQATARLVIFLVSWIQKIGTRDNSSVKWKGTFRSDQPKWPDRLKWTTFKGVPKYRNGPFHLISNRNFGNFGLNGKRPWTPDCLSWFRIPNPRILDSTGKNFPDFEIGMPLHGVNLGYYLFNFAYSFKSYKPWLRFLAKIIQDVRVIGKFDKSTDKTLEPLIELLSCPEQSLLKQSF